MGRVGLVYPYNRQFTPFLRYDCLKQDFDEFRLVSPAGWGMTDKDASRADDGNYLGVMVTSDFQRELEYCDTVIFCDYSLPLDFKNHIYTKILQSIHEKKDIVCLMPLDLDLEHELRTICNYEGVSFDCYKNESSKNYLEGFENEIDFTIKTINVPIIFVLGVGDRTNKFDIQLALREYYLENGYKVSQVGTRGYCEWLGFHSFPDFMFNKSISETQKVICFNNYINSIEKAEEPDVFIIGIPGGIIPISDILYQDFGILAYQISCAIKPDVCILSLYYGQYEQSQFEDVNKSIKHRFGFEIDCLNLANVKLDITKSIEKRKMSYLGVDNKYSEEIKTMLNLLDKPVFNISNGQDGKNIYEFTKSMLEKYAEITLVNQV